MNGHCVANIVKITVGFTRWAIVTRPAARKEQKFVKQLESVGGWLMNRCNNDKLWKGLTISRYQGTFRLHLLGVSKL